MNPSIVAELDTKGFIIYNADTFFRGGSYNITQIRIVRVRYKASNKLAFVTVDESNWERSYIVGVYDSRRLAISCGKKIADNSHLT